VGLQRPHKKTQEAWAAAGVGLLEANKTLLSMIPARL